MEEIGKGVGFHRREKGPKEKEKEKVLIPFIAREGARMG